MPCFGVTDGGTVGREFELDPFAILLTLLSRLCEFLEGAIRASIAATN